MEQKEKQKQFRKDILAIKQICGWCFKRLQPIQAMLTSPFHQKKAEILQIQHASSGSMFQDLGEDLLSRYQHCGKFYLRKYFEQYVTIEDLKNHQAYMNNPYWKTQQRHKQKTDPINKVVNAIDTIKINKSVQAKIKNLRTSQGAIYSGNYYIQTYFCDSVKQPGRLSKMPQLISSQNLPIVSLSMQSWQIFSSNKKLLFPSESIEITEKIPDNFDPNQLKKFTVWYYDHLMQVWKNVGGITISQDKKSFKYNLKYSTRQDMIKVLDNMGKYKQVENFSITGIEQSFQEVQNDKLHRLLKMASQQKPKYENQCKKYKQNYVKQLSQLMEQKQHLIMAQLQFGYHVNHEEISRLELIYSKLSQFKNISAHKNKFYEQFYKQKEVLKKQIQLKQRPQNERYRLKGQQFNKGSKKLLNSSIKQSYLGRYFKKVILKRKINKDETKRQEKITFLPNYLRVSSQSKVIESLINYMSEHPFEYRTSRIVLPFKQSRNFIQSINLATFFKLNQNLSKDFIQLVLKSPSSNSQKRYILVNPQFKTNLKKVFSYKNKIGNELKINLLEKLNRETLQHIKRSIDKMSEINQVSREQQARQIKALKIRKSSIDIDDEEEEQINNTPQKLESIEQDRAQKNILQQESSIVCQLILQKVQKQIDYISMNRFVALLQITQLKDQLKSNFIIQQLNSSAYHAGLDYEQFFQMLQSTHLIRQPPTQFRQQTKPIPIYVQPRSKMLDYIQNQFDSIRKDREKKFRDGLLEEIIRSLPKDEKSMMMDMKNMTVERIAMDTVFVVQQYQELGIINKNQASTKIKAINERIRTNYSLTVQFYQNQQIIMSIIQDISNQHQFDKMCVRPQKNTFDHLIASLKYYIQSGFSFHSQSNITQLKALFLQKYTQRIKRDKLPGGGSSSSQGYRISRDNMYSQLASNFDSSVAFLALSNITNIDSQQQRDQIINRAKRINQQRLERRRRQEEERRRRQEEERRRRQEEERIRKQNQKKRKLLWSTRQVELSVLKARRLQQTEKWHRNQISQIQSSWNQARQTIAEQQQNQGKNFVEQNILQEQNEQNNNQTESSQVQNNQNPLRDSSQLREANNNPVQNNSTQFIQQTVPRQTTSQSQNFQEMKKGLQNYYNEIKNLIQSKLHARLSSITSNQISQQNIQNFLYKTFNAKLKTLLTQQISDVNQKLSKIDSSISKLRNNDMLKIQENKQKLVKIQQEINNYLHQKNIENFNSFNISILKVENQIQKFKNNLVISQCRDKLIKQIQPEYEKLKKKVSEVTNQTINCFATQLIESTKMLNDMYGEYQKNKKSEDKTKYLSRRNKRINQDNPLNKTDESQAIRQIRDLESQRMHRALFRTDRHNDWEQLRRKKQQMNNKQQHLNQMQGSVNSNGQINKQSNVNQMKDKIQNKL